MARSRHPRVQRTAVAVALTALLAGVGSVFGAFTATTTNPGNSISTGSVALTDDDGADVALYNASLDGDLAPGRSVTRCLRVTYTGTLPADVELYGSAGTTGAAAFTLRVERGSGLSGSFPDCTGFTPDSTAYDGGLELFPTGYAAGVDGRAGAARWTTGQVVHYRITVTAEDDPTPNAHTTPTTTAPHVYTWEARSS